MVHLLLILSALLGLTACNGEGSSATAQAPTATVPAPAATSQGAAPSASDFSTTVRDVAQKVRPAVVQITNEQVTFDRFTNQPFTVPAGVGR